MQPIDQKSQMKSDASRETRVQSHGDILFGTLYDYSTRWVHSILQILRRFFRRSYEKSSLWVLGSMHVQVAPQLHSQENDDIESQSTLEENTLRNTFLYPPLFYEMPPENTSPVENPL